MTRKRVFRRSWPFRSGAVITLLALHLGSFVALAEQNESGQIITPTYDYLEQYTSKFTTRLSSRGWLGSSYKDAGPNSGFEFPAGSNTELIDALGLWVGGIVRTDTLVSVTAMREFFIPIRDEVQYSEFFNQSLPENQSPFTQIKVPGGVINETTYSDTVVGNTPELPPDFFFHRPHHPLGIDVRQKSYSLNLAPFKNILLLDYTISSVGTENIRDAYVGIYLDPTTKLGSVNLYGAGGLAGTFKESATAYAIDADGETGFDYYSPAPDAIALRFVSAYPPPTDTNFNWWLAYPAPDFGPRQKETTADPFFDFRSGRLGMPNGDINKYYLLSHPEWDYDQVMTALVPDNDPIWTYPPDIWADSIAQGQNPAMLLSVGPFHLEPRQSIRLIFSLFGAEYIHIDPDNKDELYAGNYEQFYNGLNFDFLHTYTSLSKDMSDELVDPLARPSGLELIDLVGDRAIIRWHPWVFPEVAECKVYLDKVPAEQLLTPNLPRPNASPTDPRTTFHITSAGRLVDTLNGLEPGQLYFVSVANIAGLYRGELSEPIVIGDRNRGFDLSAVKPLRQFAHFYESDSTVRLSWESETREVSKYRIYRTTDSLLAATRFSPLLSDTGLSADISPTRCWGINGRNLCFYQLTPYDSISGDASAYYDHDPVDNAWYWITAVNRFGYESELSTLIKSERAKAPTRDVLVLLGTTSSLHDYVSQDSLISFYSRLLTGLDFDLYDWSQNVLFNPACSLSSCPDWQDFADYRLILVEEFPSPRLLDPNHDGKNQLLARLLDGGHTVACFGPPPGNRTLNLASEFLQLDYSENSFVREYLGISATHIRPWAVSYQQFGVIDSLAGFCSAIPYNDDLPPLGIDLNNVRVNDFFQDLFVTTSSLPFTPAFLPERESELLYLYGSRFLTSSELHGMACGVLNHREFADAYSFSFHLWGISEGDARKLIDYIMLRSPSRTIPNSPPIIPVSLSLGQNFPNPFNGETVLSFSLDKPSKLNLEIFNILGRKVRTLISNQPFDAGKHEVTWDGRADSHKAVATGVYLYRLKTETETMTRKMVLLK
ncbi:MAG: T9SS type A sorting domain-containing protein [bacterium]|nr:T9SS type A sorting domain-containing protein [bacterium]